MFMTIWIISFYLSLTNTFYYTIYNLLHDCYDYLVDYIVNDL